VTSLVLSRLDYCNSVVFGLPASTLSPLQRVQNAAAQLVLRLDRKAHIKPALHHLHWLPVKARIEFKITTLMHAILHQHAPAYLSDIIKFNSIESARRQLRSSTTKAAVVMRTQTQFGKRVFSVCGPSICNQIPPHIRYLHSVPAFRKALKMHLFSCQF